MARTLDSFQQAGYFADTGKTLRGFFPCLAAVSYTRDQVQGGYNVRMFFTSMVTGKVVAMFENHYALESALLEDFGIDDVDEVWEVLD
jgi:hypothetical protein